MNAKHRSFPASILAIVAALTAACGYGRVVTPKESHDMTAEQLDVYFGTYTEGWSCTAETPCTGRGIYRATFDSKTGALSAPVLAHESVNPSYLAVTRKGGNRYLYAVNEVGSYGGKPTGAVSAFKIEAGGALTLLNQLPSMGADPAHVSVSSSGKLVLVANYSGGSVASFRILDDGSLQLAASVQHSGAAGPHPNQRAPHAHFIANDSRGERLFVADLGLDQVLVYALDESTGAFEPNVPPFGAVPPGSGPRHLAFEKQGRFVYANNELAQTVTVFSRDSATHALAPVQTLSSVMPGDPQGQSAEIALSADGDHLYVSNRGPNSIAVFDVTEATGQLSLKATVSTGGNWPRDFKLDPSGRFIVLGNNRSGDVLVFALDAATGLPVATGVHVPLNQVSSIVFAP
jgi:6-phosphogluconolactonase